MEISTDWEICETTGEDFRPLYLVETSGGDLVAKTPYRNIAELIVAAPMCSEKLERAMHLNWIEK
jgi:hypothetical protein